MSPDIAGSSVSLDLTDHEFRTDPYAFYRALRERAPVARLAGGPFWTVTGHRQVQALMRDPRVGAYRPSEAPTRVPPAQSGFLRARADAGRAIESFMHHQQPAEHLRLRRLSRTAFSASRTAARRARIQELTDERIDEALARGSLDVVGDLGQPVALTIAAELLGLPPALHEVCGQCARDLIYRIDVLTATPARRERGTMAMIRLGPRLRELLTDAPSQLPEDGLLWALERARREGELTEDQVVGHGAVLLMAGHVTTQHLVGNAVLALLRHPDQWDRLRDQPELIGTAVDELLRYDTPAAAAVRIALEDITIEGETVRRGDPLVFLFGAANRDPAVFHEPDVLDLARSPNPHLGFGHDAHYCLGAALARLEAEVMLGTLARRAPGLRLASGTLEWEDTLMVRGLRSLPTLL